MIYSSRLLGINWILVEIGAMIYFYIIKWLLRSGQLIVNSWISIDNIFLLMKHFVQEAEKSVSSSQVF